MPNKELGRKIKALRDKGMTYNQIQEVLGCSKGTISYHLGDGQKNKSLERMRKNRQTLDGAVAHKTANFVREREVSSRPTDYTSPRKASRLASDKVGEFCRNKESRKRENYDFTYQDVIDKHGSETVCYLTGDAINMTKPSSYEFDHIIPRKLGGENTLDNLGIATREANRAKGSMSLEDFVELCRKVVKYNDRM